MKHRIRAKTIALISLISLNMLAAIAVAATAVDDGDDPSRVPLTAFGYVGPPSGDQITPGVIVQQIRSDQAPYAVTDVIAVSPIVHMETDEPIDCTDNAFGFVVAAGLLTQRSADTIDGDHLNAETARAVTDATNILVSHRLGTPSTQGDPAAIRDAFLDSFCPPGCSNAQVLHTDVDAYTEDASTTFPGWQSAVIRQATLIGECTQG